MSNDNNSGGGIGALVVGLGFAGMLLLPVFLMRRFGIRVMSIFVALGMTALAAAHPYLIGWVAVERDQCSGLRCPADALYGLLAVLPTWGWWMVALGAWAIVVLRLWLGLDRHQEAVE